jgi:hypothetical protein
MREHRVDKHRTLVYKGRAGALTGLYFSRAGSNSDVSLVKLNHGFALTAAQPASPGIPFDRLVAEYRVRSPGVVLHRHFSITIWASLSEQTLVSSSDGAGAIIVSNLPYKVELY